MSERRGRSPFPVVTIDGPAGAGKSTVARRLAARLGYRYVSSGAVYRAVAWRVASGVALPRVLAETSVRFLAGDRVMVDGRDASDVLSGADIGEAASRLSQRPEVRAFADAIQRLHAEEGPIVVEGRDAGSVVFPDADCKFFLDASVEVRAHRRLGGRPVGAELAAVRAALQARDEADRTRSLAPLVRPPDATYVDSTALTVDEVVERMANDVKRACCTGSCSH